MVKIDVVLKLSYIWNYSQLGRKYRRFRKDYDYKENQNID